MTAAQRLYLFGVIAENAVLPFLSSGHEIGVEDRQDRRIQISAGVSTVLVGGMASNHITNPGAALKSIALKNVRNPNHGDTDVSMAISMAGVVDEAVRFWFAALQAALAAFFVPVEYLNGVGRTGTGAEEFHARCDDFRVDISAWISQAKPDPSHWSGPAAEEYETQLGQQKSRVTAMAAADGRIADLLQEQGAEVESKRKQLAAVRLAVTGAIGVASAMFIAYVRIRRESYTNLVLYEKANSMGWALVHFIQVCLLGMAGDAVEVITTLGIRGTKTKNRITNVIEDGYQWIIDDWTNKKPKNTAVGPLLAAAPAVSVVGIADLPTAQSDAAVGAADSDAAGAATGSRQDASETSFAATPWNAGLGQSSPASRHSLQQPNRRPQSRDQASPAEERTRESDHGQAVPVPGITESVRADEAAATSA